MPEDNTSGNNSGTTVDDFDDDNAGAQGGDGGDGNQDGDKSGGNGKSKVEVKDGKVFVDGDEFDAERALNTISSQRSAEKELKRQVAELSTSLKKLENKDKTPDQQLSAERDELRVKVRDLETKLSRQSLRTEALSVATELRFKNPSIAYKLIDADDVDWDDDKPVNVRQLLKDEAKANSYLLRRGRRTEEDEDEDEPGGGADGGAGRNANAKSGHQSMNDAIRTAAGRG